MQNPCRLVVLALLVAGALVLPAGGYTTLDSLAAAGRVYVSNVTIDPAVLFTGDEATVTFAVTNGNANSTSSTANGVMFNHATFGNNDIRLVSGTYDSSSSVGPPPEPDVCLHGRDQRNRRHVLPGLLARFP
jgi:hypothetical protein